MAKVGDIMITGYKHPEAQITVMYDDDNDILLDSPEGRLVVYDEDLPYLIEMLKLMLPVELVVAPSN